MFRQVSKPWKVARQNFQCEAHEDSNMTNVERDANKETSENLTTEWLWNWPETFVVDDGW